MRPIEGGEERGRRAKGEENEAHRFRVLEQHLDDSALKELNVFVRLARALNQSSGHRTGGKGSDRTTASLTATRLWGQKGYASLQGRSQHYPEQDGMKG